MTFAAAIVAYNEGRYVLPAIAQYPERVGRVMVCASSRPWFGRRAETDGEMLGKLASCGDQRVTTVRKSWPDEHGQRNWGVAALSDADWVLTLDPDEFFTPEGWEDVLDELEAAPKDAAVAVAENVVTYWKDAGWRFDDAGRHHLPVIAVRPLAEGAVFTDKRQTVDECHLHMKAPLHHLSWARTDAEVLAKVSNYSHARDFDVNAWYENVWKAWTPDMAGLPPLERTKETKAVKADAPRIIRNVCEYGIYED